MSTHQVSAASTVLMRSATRPAAPSDKSSDTSSIGNKSGRVSRPSAIGDPLLLFRDHSPPRGLRKSTSSTPTSPVASLPTTPVRTSAFNPALTLTTLHEDHADHSHMNYHLNPICGRIGGRINQDLARGLLGPSLVGLDFRGIAPKPSTSGSCFELASKSEDINAIRRHHSLRVLKNGDDKEAFSPFVPVSPRPRHHHPHHHHHRQSLSKVCNPHYIQRRFSRVQEEKAMAAAPDGPIEVSKFMQYVHERKKKRILFKGEYLMIKKSGEPHKSEHGNKRENMDKNQYPEVLPYDYNRVILPLVPGDAHSSYINASYVHGFDVQKQYIVAQAVKSKQSCVDFWRMVWEAKTNCIVMLTKVFDFMRVMCLQYWPLTKFTFGDIEVETLETMTYAHFVVRTLRLTRNDGRDECRLVQHFHFTEWELDSFPYISAFLELRRRVRSFLHHHPSEGPIVVHCSSGSGRSGAFLAVDSNLHLMEKERGIDIFSYCKLLNDSRPNLVESVEQYMFIYEVMAEAVQCNMQPFSMHLLQDRSSMMLKKETRQTMEARDSNEYKMLAHLSPGLRIGDCAGGHRLENRGKNRDVMVVPPDHARPYLQTLHGESKDYTFINAVYIDGYTRKAEWIVTEWPKAPCVDSLWALVFDHTCHTIINLSNQGNPKTYPSFIHNKGKQIYGPFVVEVLNYHSYPSMTSHMVKVMKRKALDLELAKEEARKTIERAKKPSSDKPVDNLKKRATEAEVRHLLKGLQTFMISEIMASGASTNQEAETRICCIISVKMWPIENKVPLSTTGLIDVMKMARSWRNRAPDKPETRPTIVLSHNGVSRCGIYVAANICIDQMDMDGEVDVFHAVKMIRINRPQLIDTKEEYKYLYDLMLHWYMTNPEYRSQLNKPTNAAEINHVDHA